MPHEVNYRVDPDTGALIFRSPKTPDGKRMENLEMRIQALEEVVKHLLERRSADDEV